MVNRWLLHDRTGWRLFAMMQPTDVTIVPRTYFLILINDIHRLLKLVV